MALLGVYRSVAVAVQQFGAAFGWGSLLYPSGVRAAMIPDQGTVGIA